MAGLFGNVAGAQVTGGGVYFKAGKHYRVTFVEGKTVVSAQGKGTFAIADFLTVSSDDPDLGPGKKASQVIAMGNIMGPVNVKKLVFAMFGLDGSSDTPAQLEAAYLDLIGTALSTEQICELVFDEKHSKAFEGVELVLDVVAVTTKAGRPFGRHDWRAPGA